MSRDNYKYLCFLMIFLFAYAIFNHYITSLEFTATCKAILAVADYSEMTLENLIGKNNAANCLSRISY